MLWTICQTFRNSDGKLYVRYLYWNGSKWNWNYNWLDNDFDADNPAVLATLFFLLYFMVEEFCLLSSFLYIALSDILPELQHHTKRKLWPIIVSLLAGVVVIWLVGGLVPEVHI